MAGELISREALERIIQRAAELQTGEREIGDGLTEQELIALGQDVGIPARYLRQALLEEKTRLPEEPAAGFWGWLVGPAQVSAARVVPGDRATVERALAHGMEEDELLRVKRRFPDRTTWEPKHGAFASIQRALGAGGKRYALAGAREVAGHVTQLESGFCHVQLMADVRNLRGRRISIGVTLASFGAAASGIFLGIGVLALYTVIPVALLGAAAVPAFRLHRAENERVQVALDQVLDRLEHGEIRPEHDLPGRQASPLVRIADELRKTFDI